MKISEFEKWSPEKTLDRVKNSDVGPINGKPGLKASDILVEEMITLLEDAITKKFTIGGVEVPIKLVIVTKK